MKIEELKTIINDLCGPIVADVDASVKAQVDPIRAEQTGLFTRMLAGVSQPPVAKEVPSPRRASRWPAASARRPRRRCAGRGPTAPIQILRGWECGSR